MKRCYRWANILNGNEREIKQKQKVKESLNEIIEPG
jgi:hypothetical protein